MTGDTIRSRVLGVSSIRNMDICDVPSVVALHLGSFSGFFLSFLGPAFLRELYTATLADPSGIGLVADNGENICGFVTGTSQPSGFYSRLARRRWWRFGWAAVGPVLKRPLIISRLFRAFSMPEQVTQEERCGTLMSIAVLPAHQGKGIGQALVREFIEIAARRDLRRIDLTTDRTDNDATNRFYRNLGFTCERTFATPEGRQMNVYVIDVVRKKIIG